MPLGVAKVASPAGAESSVILFIRNAVGRYTAHLGFPGRGAVPLESRSHGYPDLLIGGPGFCFAVWRWDGTTYVHLRNDPQAPGGCDHIGKD